jgi:hypothetical protein
MPMYRIYYAEREPADEDRALFSALRANQGFTGDGMAETEWEEEVEAESLPEALDIFFRGHIKDPADIMRIGEDGNAYGIDSPDFDPDASYIWVEEGNLMEYQGIDEATPGKVTCPLCDGHGEVDASTAEEYTSQYETPA